MSPGRARGGKGGAEPRARVRLREVRVLQGLLEGESQHALAAALHISQAAVSKITRRLEDRLLTDVAHKVERQRARQTLRLEHLYAEAMRAWRGSQQDALRRRQRKTEGAAAGGVGTVAEITSENRHGDPRYLEEARKALADLRTLWGVDAPDRVAVALTPFAAMSDHALELELVHQLDVLTHVRAAQGLTAGAPSLAEEEPEDENGKHAPASRPER